MDLNQLSGLQNWALFKEKWQHGAWKSTASRPSSVFNCILQNKQTTKNNKPASQEKIHIA